MERRDYKGNTPVCGEVFLLCPSCQRISDGVSAVEKTHGPVLQLDSGRGGYVFHLSVVILCKQRDREKKEEGQGKMVKEI